jgi:hypothetical protein
MVTVNSNLHFSKYLMGQLDQRLGLTLTVDLVFPF